MKSRNYGLYAVALAIVVVGALWAGLPAGTLALLGLVLVCPLMMMFMMRAMHGDQGGDRSDDDQRRDPPDRSGPHDHSSMR